MCVITSINWLACVLVHYQGCFHLSLHWLEKDSIVFEISTSSAPLLMYERQVSLNKTQIQLSLFCLETVFCQLWSRSRAITRSRMTGCSHVLVKIWTQQSTDFLSQNDLSFFFSILFSCNQAVCGLGGGLGLGSS